MIDKNVYVYRYRDWNRGGDGASALFAERRVVIKETEHFVYHISLPWDWDKNPVVDQGLIDHCLKTKGWNRARKTKKDAHVSAWRLDQKVAMADWVRRKGYQLSRLRLAIERVEDLQDTLIRHGVILPQTGHMTPEERVISAPNTVVGGVTPEAENYNWQEY
ncbi:hypothetical protein [Escherichia phage KW1E_UTAR]|nr:hypothetical protein [Escherichia phage KW1E_UTAR]